jgi:hypothetical protein
MPERTLKSGIVVKTNVVPAHAIAQVGAGIVKPAPPKVPIKSIAGHTELVTAPDDSPEWLAYVQAQNDYDERISKAKNDFTYDCAVEAWKNGTGDWQTEPPDDWKLPDVFTRHGIKAGDKRADYIRYHLLVSNEDIEIVLRDALGQTAPITDGEVSAALAGFRPGVSRRSGAGRKAKRRG